ncbi:SusC/RagA family TonB-linked outer membrane protein [Adhaeribacter pallidiroseus]|uniref:TonB-dependent receptor SusC n=1 Tax=Adhaeribacter pallidiroseus TaxID=2072847 RepID=A0A369QAV0_9BACT|nr:TonB-dependent receptor [Adhaeribacter pallidiroseus]RDC61460.1 TonB-dependent receptor SusC [Adhaeribacter pallidiroseus]
MLLAFSGAIDSKAAVAYHKAVIRTVDWTLTGKVVSASGEALPGVTILVKGTTNGTTSDLNGAFSISVPESAGTLVVSYVGYTTKEQAYSGPGAINITLADDTKALQEVVVVGYGTQKREDVTGAISSVSAAQIEKTPVTTLDQALQGRSAGVQVTNNDASPGAGIQVQIRGIGSFGNNEPLYVVDGYPISGGVNTLNPADIASMDILKDASATAIYGNRAANGVVIITTKRGKAGELQISLDALTSFQTEPNMYKLLNAEQFATLANERSVPDEFAPVPEWSNPSALRNIDWQEELYRTGLRQNYNVAVRGGGEKVQSAFSLGLVDQKGIILGSNYRRYNASVNVDYNATKWLKASTSIKYSRSDSKIALGTGGQNSGLGVGTFTKLIPTMTGNPLTDQVKDENGEYGYYTKNNTAVSYLDNPLAVIETQDQKNQNNYLLASAYLEATLAKGLRLKTNLGVNISDFSGYYFTPSNNRLQAPVLSNYSQSATNTSEYLWENTLAYTRTFGVHTIDFVGGFSFQDNTIRQIGAGGNGQISDVLRNLTNVQTITNIYGDQYSTSLASQFGRVSYNLLDRYLLTATVRRDGSSRFAQNNQYGVFPSVSVAWRVKNEAFLANVNALSDLKIRASYGQVGNQASIDPFKYLAQYSTGGSQLSINNNGYPFNKKYQEGLVLQGLPNPGLKWETSVQTDIGLDAYFLNNKISLTADYYRKESRDFLLNINVPAQTGFSTATRNVGSIRNSGIELGIEYREAEKPFKYGIAANITTVKNEILNLGGLSAIGNIGGLGFPNVGGNTWVEFSRSEVGGEIGAFYGYQNAGIFQTQAEIDALNARASEINGANTPYQATTTVPGDRKFVDQITVDSDGDGVPDARDGKITANDRVVLGSPIPDFFGGLNLDASFKNFDFNMFWYASVGNEIFNYTSRVLQNFGATQGGIGLQNIGEEYYLNRWTATNPSNTYPRVTRPDLNGNTRPSDAYIEDGSYLRLRNVQIGYTFPTALTQRATIQKVRVFVSAQNLVTFTKYSGLDPEIGQIADPDTGRRNVTMSGVDVGTYPLSRYFGLGLNVTF